jgi:hypothetical protein
LCVLLAGKMTITKAVRRANQMRQCSEKMKTLAMALHGDDAEHGNGKFGDEAQNGNGLDNTG